MEQIQLVNPAFVRFELELQAALFHLQTRSPAKMRLAWLKPLLRLVVIDCSPVIGQSGYGSFVIDMTANAPDISMGGMVSGLFWIPALVSQHYCVSRKFPALRFSAARLAHRKNYRILCLLVAKRYSENNLLYHQRVYDRFSIQMHPLKVCHIPYSSNILYRYFSRQVTCAC